MDDICICKVPLENLPGDSLLVYSKWNTESFSMNVFHKDGAWHKSVSESDLRSLPGMMQMSLYEYLNETKRALTSDGGCADFTYAFVKSELIWKKIVDHGIKVKFGAVMLKEMPVSSFSETAIEFLLTKCSTLQSTNEAMKKENDDLRAANTSLRTHVSSIAKLKSEMEEALYAKSLAVLNAKKEKICKLQEAIESHPTTSGTSRNADCKTENIEKNISPSKLNELYGSETEIDTDCSSDLDYNKKSSTSRTGMKTKVNEEEKDFLPTSAKSIKLVNISPEKAKIPPEGEDYDSDDIFVPVRRKKNTKS